ncbi:DTW domain-containing protein [uncultured Shewanella sp.]|uniref:DTW domain-containing protein n=1 Tax=uncultured Shewanella sp. TaxID=173975 RepID=UPI0026076678|nr:tRNA-uridine aminocarboxypropyltransferase [uncultured Shewanella sp.]
MIESFQIVLLTHEREVERSSNTGQIALRYFPEYCQRVIWSRVDPDPKLVDLLSRGEGVLLFPDELFPDELFPDEQESMGMVANQSMEKQLDPLHHQCHGPMNTADERSASNVPNVIVILDATWQEARKMCRRSHYLKQAMKYALPKPLIDKHLSQFRLRRNQIQGGFCTIECIQFLFRLKGMHAEATVLESAFKNFNQNDDKIT